MSILIIREIIKSQFDSNFNPETLSEEEAKVKLQQSFDVGQKLLDNRKKYADKNADCHSVPKGIEAFFI